MDELKVSLYLEDIVKQIGHLSISELMVAAPLHKIQNVILDYILVSYHNYTT